jgi:hypothetical protein
MLEHLFRQRRKQEVQDMLLFGDKDGELRVGHLRLLIIGDQGRGRSHNIVIKELGELSSLQGRHNQSSPEGKVGSRQLPSHRLQSRNMDRRGASGSHCRFGRKLCSDTMKDFFGLTTVPLPHAGYVFIYAAFTTDLLQIF